MIFASAGLNGSSILIYIIFHLFFDLKFIRNVKPLRIWNGKLTDMRQKRIKQIQYSSYIGVQLAAIVRIWYGLVNQCQHKCGKLNANISTFEFLFLKMVWFLLQREQRTAFRLISIYIWFEFVFDSKVVSNHVPKKCLPCFYILHPLHHRSEDIRSHNNKSKLWKNWLALIAHWLVRHWFIIYSYSFLFFKQNWYQNKAIYPNLFIISSFCMLLAMWIISNKDLYSFRKHFDF